MTTKSRLIRATALILAVISVITLAACAGSKIGSTPYAEVYGKLSALSRQNNGMRTYDLVQDAAIAESVEAPTATDSAEKNGDYSKTNTQVDGIDESDVVKTDGKYIYSVTGNTVKIIAAEGKDTALVSELSVCDEKENKYCSGMYVENDVLALIMQKDRYYYVDDFIEDGFIAKKTDDRNETKCEIRFYDVSDAKAPKLLTVTTQDGYYRDSRLKDGILYIVTNYDVYNEKPSDPGTYIPNLCDGVRGEHLIAEDCIVIPDTVSFKCFTVMAAVKLTSGEILSEMSVLGGTGMLYMSDTAIFTAKNSYDEETLKEYKEDQYTVKETKESAATEIMRFACDAGKIAQPVNAKVDGYTESQFSMDEQDGYLRIVTTERSYTAKVYTDEKHGWENYEPGEEKMSNSLFILDENLKTVGSITDLAENEQIYSARFYGDIGYFVTFRTVDPLFSADLSDPYNPKILGELKIPGFSTYMQSYGEGLLFGIGNETKEVEGGRVTTDGMKLSMFDVSDPANVKEAAKTVLKDNYSDALYDHHAILCDSGKNIIGFATHQEYLIYGYGADGFYKKASIPLTLYGYNVRGIYIGGDYYIVSADTVTVLDMTEYTKTAEISLT